MPPLKFEAHHCGEHSARLYGYVLYCTRCLTTWIEGKCPRMKNPTASENDSDTPR
jgi:hypothetical protein